MELFSNVKESSQDRALGGKKNSMVQISDMIKNQNHTLQSVTSEDMLPRENSAERADSVFNYDRVRLQIKKDYQEELQKNRGNMARNLPKTTNATPMNIMSPEKVNKAENVRDYTGSPFSFNTTYKDLGVSAKVHRETGANICASARNQKNFIQDRNQNGHLVRMYNKGGFFEATSYK